jgi:microcystin-dependent protein
MKASDIPSKFQVPFGNSALGADIRAIPLTTADPNAASLQAGFPPPTFTPVGAGGAAPDGRDFNGLFNQSTAWDRWFSAGGPVAWDSGFSAAIGGYPLGAIVRSLTIPASSWISTADDNVTNPDAGGAGWSAYGPSTGDVRLTLKAAADYGWLMLNDGTVGNAGSGAGYANANASALFNLLWGLNATYVLIFTSGGGASTRGGSAAADFSALKRISLPIQLGRAFAAAGAGSGLTSRVAAQFLGEEAHQLTIPELAAHTHPSLAIITLNFGTPSTPVNLATTGTTGSTGNDQPHNNMQPSTFWNAMIKL